jgi:hypothetical protein
VDRWEEGGGGVNCIFFLASALAGSFYKSHLAGLELDGQLCGMCVAVRYGTARHSTLIVRNGEGLAAALVIRFGCEFLERGWILSMVCACFSAPYPFLACSMSGCKLLNEKRGSMCT